MKILIIDSQKTISGIIADMLSLQGHEVFETARGIDALELLSGHNPEVVIMDAGITDISPVDFLRKVRNLSKSIKIILLTDTLHKEIEQHAHDFGLFESIDRNIGSELFIRLVNKLIKNISKMPKDEKANVSNLKDKILVADDSMLIRKTLQDFLSEKNYNVITAKDGEEAIQRIKNEKPSLVLLDITMPKMDGIAVMNALKEENIEVPIIVITSITDINIAKNTLNLGAFDYIAKPINFEYLETSILAKIMHRTY